MRSVVENKKVVPGQYITPIYKRDDENSVIDKFIAGRGTTITTVNTEDSKMKQLPVVAASILGRVIIQEVNRDNDKDEEDKEGNANQTVRNFVVTVVQASNAYKQLESDFDIQQTLSKVSINLPQENDVVLVRIMKITQRQAYCEILSVEGFGNVLQDGGSGANGESAHISVAVGGGGQNTSNLQTIAASQTASLNAAPVDLGETFKGIIRSQDIRSTDRDKIKVLESFMPGDIVRALIISLGDGSNYYLSTARNDLGVIFAKSQGGSGDIMYPLDWQTMIDKKSGIIEKRKCAKPFID